MFEIYEIVKQLKMLTNIIVIIETNVRLYYMNMDLRLSHMP